MQAKWEQIFASTFVLCLYERLAFGTQLGEIVLQVHRRPDPRAGISPTRACAQTFRIKKYFWSLRFRSTSWRLAQPISRVLSDPDSTKRRRPSSGQSSIWTQRHRGVQAAYPRLERNEQLLARISGFCLCLALLLVGVAWPSTLLPAPVVSYTTFSPLPQRLAPWGGHFLWPYPRVTPTGCYPAPCSLERGLSSSGIAARDCPVDPTVSPIILFAFHAVNLPLWMPSVTIIVVNRLLTELIPASSW